MGAATREGGLEQLVLKENELVLVSDELGDIAEGRRRLGLYYRDTRYLSLFDLTINSQKPRLMASSSQQNYACDIQLASPTVELPNGNAARARTISIHRSRFLKDGLQERITLHNYNPFPVPLELTLVFGSDFWDIFEVRGLEREKRGTITQPVFADSRLNFSYSGLDGLKRSTEIVFDTTPSKWEVEGATRLLVQRASTFLPEATAVTKMTLVRPPSATVTWNLNLEPMEPLSLTFLILVAEGETVTKVTPFEHGLSGLRQSYQDWLGQCAQIQTDNQLFNRLLERSILDLRLLLEQTPEGQVPAAGIPWFCCVFGPDSLITSLQTLMLNPNIAIHTLRHLAKHQGTKVDPWHDEEPGKIVHEIRKGELARTGEIPHSAYYGSVDATPLFLILFAETMKWLDDDDLFREILPAAKLALEWMNRYGDIDGDGYLEYLSRSTGGIRDQGWKDSRGAISYDDGTPVAPPIALAEVQGYAYRAMKEMAELLERKGEPELARSLTQRARALKESFNRDFWLEEQRYFAHALDSQKKAAQTVSSNVGHCLFCDIIDEEKAKYVVTRLTSAEMACGWGIRTLSSRALRFNPMSYRNGSVWPHDNSLIAAGMKRYGYHWEVEEITSQLFDASAFFSYNRLPELFGGFYRNRDAYSIPAVHPASCSPQACAAGSAFLLFQSMLGLQVDAAAKRIYLNPRLPNWLQHASVENLRIGKKTLNLHFDRRTPEEATRFEISQNVAGVEVVIPPR